MENMQNNLGFANVLPPVVSFPVHLQQGAESISVKKYVCEKSFMLGRILKKIFDHDLGCFWMNNLINRLQNNHLSYT
jgi:hypothetical protein